MLHACYIAASDEAGVCARTGIVECLPGTTTHMMQQQSKACALPLSLLAAVALALSCAYAWQRLMTEGLLRAERHGSQSAAVCSGHHADVGAWHVGGSISGCTYFLTCLLSRLLTVLLGWVADQATAT